MESESLFYIAMIFMLFLFRVLKDLQDWKEAPLDCVVLSLYQLQAFYLNETKRGLAGLGKYTIAPGFSLGFFQVVQHHLDCLVHHLDHNGMQLCTTWVQSKVNAGYGGCATLM